MWRGLKSAELTIMLCTSVPSAGLHESPSSTSLLIQIHFRPPLHLLLYIWRYPNMNSGLVIKKWKYIAYYIQFIAISILIRKTGIYTGYIDSIIPPVSAIFPFPSFFTKFKSLLDICSVESRHDHHFYIAFIEKEEEIKFTRVAYSSCIRK